MQTLVVFIQRALAHSYIARDEPPQGPQLDWVRDLMAENNASVYSLPSFPPDCSVTCKAYKLFSRGVAYVVKECSDTRPSSIWPSLTWQAPQLTGFLDGIRNASMASSARRNLITPCTAGYYTSVCILISFIYYCPVKYSGESNSYRVLKVLVDLHSIVRFIPFRHS